QLRRITQQMGSPPAISRVWSLLLQQFDALDFLGGQIEPYLTWPSPHLANLHSALLIQPQEDPFGDMPAQGLHPQPAIGEVAWSRLQALQGKVARHLRRRYRPQALFIQLNRGRRPSRGHG